MGMGFPWESHEKCLNGTEIDEQEIKNLLYKHSDLEYKCQNYNECELFWTLKLKKSINFVVLYFSLYV